LNKSPKLPLIAYDDLHAYKIYCFDVGLLRRMSRLDPIAFTEGNRLFMEFKGALIENYILQSLAPQIDAEARYWTSDVKAEVDFIIQWKNEIIPIEVKADENIKSRSLTLYHQQYKCPLRIRYSLKNLELKDGLLNIPHFLADYTSKLIELAFLHIFNAQSSSS
jgi:predicted AAA+ superfamily ATPase